MERAELERLGASAARIDSTPHYGARDPRSRRYGRQIVDRGRRPTTRSSRPRWPRRPVPHRRARPRRPRPDGDVPPLGRVHAVHGGMNVTGQPAISLPLFEDDGLPCSACSSIGRPADEAALLALAAQLEAPRAVGRPPPAARADRQNGRLSLRPPSTARIGRGDARAPRRPRCPGRRSSSTCRAARPRPRSPAPWTSSGLELGRRRTPASRAASGRARSAGARPAARRASADDRLVGERVGPGELVTRAARAPSAPSSTAITQSATSSAQIGWNSARPRPRTGTTGSSARRSSSVRSGSPGE